MRRIPVWPVTLRGRFSASLALASVLLFIVVYMGTALVTGISVWPTGSDTMTNALVPLGLGGLALAAGFGLGLMLARVIRVPIEQFAAYVRQQGLAALEGRSTDSVLMPEADLPAELQSLADTIEQLLRQLALRQADLHDVTRRALHSEETFRSVVNASSEVKLLLRGDVIEIANPAAATFLGRPLGSLLEAPLTDVLSTFTIATETGTPIRADMLLSHIGDETLLVHCLDNDGIERWAECTVTQASQDAGISLLTIHDVTERRTLEELRTEIVSVVSHDLRAPLTVVSGYLDMLSGPVDDEQRLTIVAKARAATSRMAEMLEDLLDTARTGNGLQSNRWTPVSLGELAENVVSSLPTHVGHELVIEHRADVAVMGDVKRLEQALTNLLMNAVKHTPEETTIRLQVHAEADQALLVVEDGGSGVPELHRERIFERYTRLGEASGDGAGLGLYIVKTVAESHGGQAYVEDAENGGARFVIRLPFVPPDSL